MFDTDAQALERANGSASHIEHAVRDEGTRRVVLVSVFHPSTTGQVTHVEVMFIE
jgi:hypothetical protein